jgi:hypothetical protein
MIWLRLHRNCSAAEFWATILDRETAQTQNSQANNEKDGTDHDHNDQPHR